MKITKAEEWVCAVLGKCKLPPLDKYDDDDLSLGEAMIYYALHARFLSRTKSPAKLVRILRSDANFYRKAGMPHLPDYIERIICWAKEHEKKRVLAKIPQQNCKKDCGHCPLLPQWGLN